MNRNENLSRLSERFDVLVIGGGATGLGVAVDAAARGYHTALVERADFAQGTSSRSTKLAHGGVRYLQQRNVGLVREALRERGLMLQHAPHLVKPLTFLVPAYRWWELPFYGSGLSLYSLLAGRLGLERSTFVGPRRARELVPTIERKGLRGGVLYSDALFDDARLAIALARTADEQGAVLLNYVEVVAFLKENGRVVGAMVADRETGSGHQVRARVVVNATGVFGDSLRRLDDPAAAPILSASQGTHLVLDQRVLPGDTALLVPHTEDGRVVFAIPWQGTVLLGTTDIPVGQPEPEPIPLPGEVDYLLEQARPYLAVQPTTADVLSVFSGLRPLVKGEGATTAALSRDHTVLVSSAGLVTIAGGKWTTYRHMAERTVDRAAQVGGLPPSPCLTQNLRLWGADAPPGPWQAFGVPPEAGEPYEERYSWRLHPDLPYSAAMVAYAVEREMAVRLEDVLSRRLRALLLSACAAYAVAPLVAVLMAEIMGKGESWVEREVAAFRALATHYLPPERR
ncbi:MAG: glycerol-3-phosphate dehydrogenase/oxidase [Chloroflexota bacterium]